VRRLFHIGKCRRACIEQSLHPLVFDMLILMQPAKIRLHLVHGTWAKGFWGTAPAWSEAGEPAYQSLLTKLPANTQFESFNWSGRNSIAARTRAANDLREHLRCSLREHPKDCHVLLAHSHGGTIANEAVRGSDLDGTVRGLICLATPFAYLVSPSLGRLQTGILALASLCYAAYWTGLMALMPWIPQFLGTLAFVSLVGVKSLLAFLMVAIIAKASFERRTPILQPSGPMNTPVFLLRGSRDEASLLLAEAQLFDTFCAAFANAHEVTQARVRQPLSLIAYTLVYVICLAIGVYVATHLAPAHVGDEALEVLAIGVYAPAVAGLVYYLGYAVISMGAGHWSILHWLSSVVEVEAAPPNTVCQMYVFSELDTRGLRHGLYEDRHVLERVAKIVQSIASP
jgi:hypothetical protein